MPHNPPIFDFENWQPRFHYELVAAERLGWLTPDRVPFHLAVSEHYRLQFLTVRRDLGFTVDHSYLRAVASILPDATRLSEDIDRSLVSTEEQLAQFCVQFGHRQAEQEPDLGDQDNQNLDEMDEHP